MATTAQPERDDAPLTATNPTYWLLLLLAVVAFAWWYFANRNDAAPAATQELGIIEGTTGDEAASAPATAATAERSAANRDSASRSRSSSATAGTVAAIRQPQLLSATKPQYPAAARSRGVEGDVLLRINVGADGVPTDVDYASRSGDPTLDRAAMTAAQRWRFQPATRNGDAVASVVQVPVAFRL